MAQQGRGQHVLNECGLARSAHAGHTHEALQRELNRDVFQIVLGDALQNETRRVLCHQTLEAHTNLLAPTQVSACQRIGAAQVLRAAIKHNLPTALAGAGAHIDHAVGGQHHGGVVLYHHQRVTGVTQALHGHNNAVHIARVQADAGLVQHKQRVDQRGAQCGGEVDALYLTAA